MNDEGYPHNIEAEVAVIGALLFDPAQVTNVVRYVKASDFYLEKHQWMFTAILNAISQGNPDVITVSSELDKDGKLEAVGGVEAVMEFVNSTPSAPHAAHYAKIVLTESINRQIIELSEQMIDIGYDKQKALDDKLQELRVKLSEIQHNATRDNIHAVQNPADEIAGLSTWSTALGIKPFDKLLRFVSGKIHIIVGSPNSGKTTIGIQSALWNAKHGIESHVLLAETDTIDARSLVLSSHMRVPAWLLSNMQYDPNSRTQDKIDYIRREWDNTIPKNLPLYLHDMRSRTPTNVIARLESIHDAFVIIDHAYAFIYQSEKMLPNDWKMFITFFKDIEQVAIRNRLVAVVFNQFTKSGVSDWENPHSMFGGAGGHNIACTQINMKRDNTVSIGNKWAGVDAVVTKAKAKLVSKQLPSGEVVTVNPEGERFTYYINLPYRAIFGSPHYEGER